MVTDRQVRRLMELLGKGKNLCASAAKGKLGTLLTIVTIAKWDVQIEIKRGKRP